MGRAQLAGHSVTTMPHNDNLVCRPYYFYYFAPLLLLLQTTAVVQEVIAETISRLQQSIERWCSCSYSVNNIYNVTITCTEPASSLFLLTACVLGTGSTLSAATVARFLEGEVTGSEVTGSEGTGGNSSDTPRFTRRLLYMTIGGGVGVVFLLLLVIVMIVGCVLHWRRKRKVVSVRLSSFRSDIRKML